jgi:hypothetical protein
MPVSSIRVSVPLWRSSESRLLAQTAQTASTPTRISGRFLLTPDRILDAADGVLDLALDHFGLALRRQLGITKHFSNRRLGLAFQDFC